MNYIVRPAWCRPEMFFKSIESEIIARKYWKPFSEYTTVFLLDKGYDKLILPMVEEYPYEKEVVERKEQYFFSNIILGLDRAMDYTDDHVIVIVEDIILHKTYFKYLDTILSSKNIGRYSSIVSHNRRYRGHVNAIFRGNRFLDWGSLIKKDFFLRYVRPGLKNFIMAPEVYLHHLDKKYQKYYPFPYLYKDDVPPEHYHQDGYLRRCCNIARIKENLPIITPAINRSLHIGFYGSNRYGGRLKGENIAKRIKNLEYVIDNNLLYAASQQPEYKDYTTFDPELDEWDSNLIIVDSEGK